jgi:hypothetical protein
LDVPRCEIGSSEEIGWIMGDVKLEVVLKLGKWW